MINYSDGSLLRFQKEQSISVYLATLKETKHDLYDQLTKDCLEFLTLEQQEKIFKEKVL
jgi:hypothetical protein